MQHDCSAAQLEVREHVGGLPVEAAGESSSQSVGSHRNAHLHRVKWTARVGERQSQTHPAGQLHAYGTPRNAPIRLCRDTSTDSVAIVFACSGS